MRNESGCLLADFYTQTYNKYVTSHFWHTATIFKLQYFLCSALITRSSSVHDSFQYIHLCLLLFFSFMSVTVNSWFLFYSIEFSAILCRQSLLTVYWSALIMQNDCGQPTLKPCCKEAAALLTVVQLRLISSSRCFVQERDVFTSWRTKHVTRKMKHVRFDFMVTIRNVVEAADLWRFV